jgi:hypothetical protein
MTSSCPHCPHLGHTGHCGLAIYEDVFEGGMHVATLLKAICHCHGNGDHGPLEKDHLESAHEG